jgi:hypothetical protein
MATEVDHKGTRYVVVDSAPRRTRDDHRRQELLSRTEEKLLTLAERVREGGLPTRPRSPELDLRVTRRRTRSQRAPTTRTFARPPPKSGLTSRSPGLRKGLGIRVPSTSWRSALGHSRLPTCRE